MEIFIPRFLQDLQACFSVQSSSDSSVRSPHVHQSASLLLPVLIVRTMRSFRLSRLSSIIPSIIQSLLGVRVRPRKYSVSSHILQHILQLIPILLTILPSGDGRHRDIHSAISNLRTINLEQSIPLVHKTLSNLTVGRIPHH